MSKWEHPGVEIQAPILYFKFFTYVNKEAILCQEDNRSMS